MPVTGVRTEDRAEARADAGTRLRARLALLAAAAALAALLATLGSGGLLIPLAGVLGLAVSAAGAWVVVAHRGPLRLLGAVLALGAPLAVLVLLTVTGLWLPALVAVALWSAAAVCGRSALRRVRRTSGMRSSPARRPRRAVVIMNPRSGGGKVARFGLVEKAEKLGAEVVLLGGSGHQDVAEIAARAVAGGADALGVAGGDGTQALIAAVAADHDVPLLVVSAGTRNHFAMDLGLDREDPARCLDALTDGEELRVDLGWVAGRPFVNTVSFGVYAEVVQSPQYRDAKAGTALAALPDLLTGHLDERLDAILDGARLNHQQALLVSNNPYASGEPFALGYRPRLDQGCLGVLAVRVENAGQASALALRGERAPGVRTATAQRVVVGPPAGSMPVAIDGEAVNLPAPVMCTIRPRALRVLVPRGRPGVREPTPLSWRLLLSLAFGGASRDEEAVERP